MKTKPDITCITPTRDAPEAFALCERWMTQQFFTGVVQWIVVDDGDVPITFDCELDPTYIRRERHPSDPAHTLGLNLLAALPLVASEKLLIIEHDDYYPPDYLSWMFWQLESADMVGLSRARYYNVRDRRWQVMRNFRHSSLCTTGLAGPAIIELAHVCRQPGMFIDDRLWRRWRGSKTIVPSESAEATGAVGIKCLPGFKTLDTLNGVWSAAAPGTIAIGHDDQAAEMLRRWIPDDYETYLPYFIPPIKPIEAEDGPRGLHRLRAAVDACGILHRVRGYVRVKSAPRLNANQVTESTQGGSHAKR